MQPKGYVGLGKTFDVTVSNESILGQQRDSIYVFNDHSGYCVDQT